MAAAVRQTTALLCLHQHCSVIVLLLQAVAGKLPVREVLYNKTVRYLLMAVDCSQQQLEALPTPDPQSLLKLHTEGDVNQIILTCAGSCPSTPTAPICALSENCGLCVGSSQGL